MKQNTSFLKQVVNNMTMVTTQTSCSLPLINIKLYRGKKYIKISR